MLENQTTLIQPENTLVILSLIVLIATVSIILEQKYQWANKITGPIIGLVIAMLLANFKVIPIGSAAENLIWSYVVPLSLPMLLFQANIVKIRRESGRLFFLYLLSAGGTIVGGFLSFFLFSGALSQNPLVGEHTPALTAMFTGSYIGGSVNFAAMAETFGLSGTPLSGAAVVADNLLMAFYFLLLVGMASSAFLRKRFSTPLIDEIEGKAENKEATISSQFWGKKPISLKDIASVLAISFLIVALCTELSGWIGSTFAGGNWVSAIFIGFIGNKYLLITTGTLLLSTFFPKFFSQLGGAQELGTFFIYLFLVVIGIPASIPEIIRNAPLLLAFTAVIVLVNLIITFLGAKIFKFSLEESILVSNANIGGPTTAVAFAISQGWTKLVGPILLVGILGYVIGNYAGLFVAYVVSSGAF